MRLRKMGQTLVGSILCLSLPVCTPRAANATKPPNFCTARAPVCKTSADCPGGLRCSRDWNPRLAWLWSAGHCMDPTGKVSSTQAIQADLCSLPDPVEYSPGTLYELPAGSKLRIDDPDGDGVALTIYRRTILEGNGATLVVPSAGPKLTAIRVVVPVKNQDFEAPAPSVAASWSTLRDLALIPDVMNNTPNQHTGIHVQAHGTRLENIRVWHLGRCIDLDAKAREYNANAIQATGLVVSGCWSYGIYTHGADTNAGVFVGPEVIGGVGVRDSSFLGNLWLGATIQGNDKVSNDSAEGPSPKSYSLANEGNYSTYVNTYIELSDPKPTSTAISSTWVGGNAIGRVVGQGDQVGYGRSRLTFRGPDGYRVILGGNGAAMLFQHASERYGWQLKLRDGKWGLWSEDNQNAVFRWLTSEQKEDRGRLELGEQSTPVQAQRAARAAASAMAAAAASAPPAAPPAASARRAPASTK